VEQAQRFHQQATFIAIQGTSNHPCTSQPLTKNQNPVQRPKVNIDSKPNLEYIPFLFGGTAALVPPYLAEL